MGLLEVGVDDHWATRDKGQGHDFDVSSPGGLSAGPIFHGAAVSGLPEVVGVTDICLGYVLLDVCPKRASDCIYGCGSEGLVGV